MLGRVEVGGFRNKVLRTAAGLWVPMFDALVPRHQNVLAVLGSPGDRPLLIPGSNIVTNAGDQYYAELLAIGKAGSGSPTNNFNELELHSAGTPAKGADRSAFTPIGSTQKAKDATYPKVNDDDTDNSGTIGVDVLTWRFSYAKGDFTAASITHGSISVTSPGASAALLTGFAFASAFGKTADDTLKVFVNHELTGV